MSNQFEDARPMSDVDAHSLINDTTSAEVDEIYYDDDMATLEEADEADDDSLEDED